MKTAKDQLRLKVEEVVNELESITDSDTSKKESPSGTYSNLTPDERQSILKGLKEILNDPGRIEANQDIIPIHLVMIYPQMREIQILINKIVNEE